MPNKKKEKKCEECKDFGYKPRKAVCYCPECKKFYCQECAEINDLVCQDCAPTLVDFKPKPK